MRGDKHWDWPGRALQAEARVQELRLRCKQDSFSLRLAYAEIRKLNKEVEDLRKLLSLADEPRNPKPAPPEASKEQK